MIFNKVTNLALASAGFILGNLAMVGFGKANLVQP